MNPFIPQRIRRFLVATLVAATALVAESGGSAAVAGNTQFIVVNSAPLGSYDVLKNGASLASPTATSAGTITFSDVTSQGDAITIRLTGIDPFPPSTLTGMVATGQDDGCARIQWDTPPASDYVSSYTIYFGTSPAAYSDSASVDRLLVSQVGTTSSYTVCGFAAGTYYFAVRSRNDFDLYSPLSAEVSATVDTGDQQGLPIPQGVSASEDPPGCASVTWNALGDPGVIGYRVYYGATSAVYTDSVDAAVPSADICGFSSGRYYFAVRSVGTGGAVSRYSAQVGLTMIGPDETGPVVYDEMPAPGETGVARNTGIYFVVSDARSAVDRNSIAITVGGAAPANVVVLGNASGYIVQATPGSELPADSPVDVTVRVSDLASPANETIHTWQFTTGSGSILDTDPPVLSAVAPAAGAVDVRPDAPVVVRISDGGLGVDLGSVTMFVDDIPVSYAVDGTPQSLTVTYVPPGGFARGSHVTVRVDACDRSPSINCAAPYVFSFDTEQDFYAGMADGAIVPDGYWSGDPDRPLEIRNLPLSWTVRIFDAAGSQVKRYSNNVSEGFVWLWDFTNDHNQRVARALYLVRVFDANGNVQQSGRFLVQTDP